MWKVKTDVINKARYTGILLLFVMCFSNSCEEKFERTSKEVDLINIQDPYHELPAYKFTVSISSLKSLYEKNGIQNPDSFVKYPVSCHRLVYTTTYKGKSIKASGAIVIPIIPQTVPPPAIVSYMHGTMYADRDAPSAATSTDNFPLFNEYVLFLPDYIGYGESNDILHPYFIYESTTTSVIDMIKAGKKYLDDNYVRYDPNKLFLTGHSEGGYVTVAVQKELEKNPVDGLKVTASAPSAGPYDVELIGNLILHNDTYLSPAYLLLILTAYNDFYWQRQMTDFFQYPYSANGRDLLRGIYNEDEINQRLSSNLNTLLNPAFLNDFRNDGEKELKEMFKENSVNDWATKTPTRFYHGTSDELVPFQISQETYESFISNGSDSSIVKLVPLSGIGHEYFPAYMLILKWFKSFK